MLWLFAPLTFANPTTIADASDHLADGSDGASGGSEYAGSSNGINTGYGDVVGATSELYLDSNANGDLVLGLTQGPGTFDNVVVIYIDTTSGGFSDTTDFDHASIRSDMSVTMPSFQSPWSSLVRMGSIA